MLTAYTKRSRELGDTGMKFCGFRGTDHVGSMGQGRWVERSTFIKLGAYIEIEESESIMIIREKALLWGPSIPAT